MTLAVLLLAAGVLAGCGSGGEEARKPPARPTPAASPTPATPAAPPAAAAAPGSPGLAIGITEPNPAFFRPDGAAGAPPEPFARWRPDFDRIRPSLYRLEILWQTVQPIAETPPNLDQPNAGCLRAVPPCASWLGVRDQLRAIAARQRQPGGWPVLVVLDATPDWAARPPSGCERPGTQPRSRPPRTDALPAYQQLVGAILDVARQEGADLRYWSAWNEPNHPYFISPQRSGCSGGDPSVAVEPYVEMVRALNAALDVVPGDQEYVLGELAALRTRTGTHTSVREFVRALPADLVCGTRIWSQHAYVGGWDPVRSAAAGLAAQRCPTPHELWMTETGVNLRRGASERAPDSVSRRRECEAMDTRLRRWHADPRVTAAFQYTFREDDRFQTGLATTALDAAFPVLRAWQAWGGTRGAQDPPPVNACAGA